MSTVMITCRVQTFIQFDEVMDADGDAVELVDNEEYMKKRSKFLGDLDSLGDIDVEHEDYF